MGVLGVVPRLLSDMPCHAVAIVREKQSVSLGETAVDFDAVLARPSVSVRTPALFEVI